MTGAVWHYKVARFRVVPYFAREKIELPEGIMSIIDCDAETLGKIMAQEDKDEELKRDYLMDKVYIESSNDSESE